MFQMEFRGNIYQYVYAGILLASVMINKGNCACSGIDEPNSTRIPTDSSFTTGAIVTYTCITGYETSVPDTRTCQSDGTWTGAPPICTIKTCAKPVPAIPNSSIAPDQATYDYSTSITYSCNTGYTNTSGDLVRTCQADTTWSGTQPICTINKCAKPVPAIPNSSIAPDQATYDYSTSITYSCNTGYTNTSGDLVRTCQADTTWSGSQPVCTINKCAKPVPAIPNSSIAPDQATYDYSTSITYSCNTGYTNTSGDLVRTCQADTTWSGTQPVCTINKCAKPMPAIPNSSIAPDQATYDYSTSITYSCNTGYTNTSGDLVRTCQADTTWSGSQPVCTINKCAKPVPAIPNSSIAPDQATYDYSTSITYACNTGYTNTSGDLVRTCQADTAWSGSQPVCTINKCAKPVPAIPNSSIAPDQATYDYSTSITYSCNTGYTNTSGDLVRTCQADTTWSGTQPVCTINTCAKPAPAIPNSSISPDQATYDYSTSITYSCNTGYTNTSGDLVRTCQADTTWSGSQPVCTINICPNPLAIPNSSISPDQATYDYSTSITYSCNTGYTHTSGVLVRTCQADTTWSGTQPVCTINTCASPPAIPNSVITPDQPAYNFSTTITYSCNTGYTNTSGDLVRTCQADTTWSGTQPICTINTCASPQAILNSVITPDQPAYNYSTAISYSCNTGYTHTRGDLVRICQAAATWSGNQLVCTINTCANPPAIPNSGITPDQPAYNYSTSISYSCNTGFTHTSGDLVRTCQADITWSGTEPICTINTCASPPAIQNSVITPDKPAYNYSTSISYSCYTDYTHKNGDLVRTCKADTTWSGTQPLCTINTCASPPAIPNSVITPDQPAYNYSTSITYSCNTGYTHTSGDLVRTCQADITWSGTQPICTSQVINMVNADNHSQLLSITNSRDIHTGTLRFSVNTCASPQAIPNSVITPDQPAYNYSTSISYSCNTGYTHTSGNLVRTCQADITWSGTEPICTINTCASLPAIPNSAITPDQPVYNYSTAISYSCNTGYTHTSGDLVRTCQADITWSGLQPICTIITCTSPLAIPNSSKSPDQPVYNYSTSISYSCNTGYTHTSGDLVRTCQANTTWSGTQPVCTINTCTSSLAIPNSSKSPEQATYDYSTFIIYSCDTGYIHTSRELLRICQANTTWSGTQPVCTIKTCAGPPAIPNYSVFPEQAAYNYSTTITYACNTGYTHTSGDLVRTCQADTTWSDPQPICTIKTCSSPAAVSDSTRAPDQASYDYSTSVNYTCDTGYSHTGGDIVRTCQADTTWSGNAPICTIKTCASPAAVSDSTRVPDQASYDYSTSVNYTCDTGYSHTGGDLVRTCQADTTWSGNAPVCTFITCTNPTTVPNSSHLPIQASFNYAESITYTCNTGYTKTSGDSVRTCDEINVWSGNQPICTINTCTTADVPNSSKLPNQATIDYAQSVTYTCDLLYNHTGGLLTRLCQANSTLTGDAPVCTLAACSPHPSLTFGTVSPVKARYEFGDEVTITCTIGYYMSAGDGVRGCDQGTGSWNGTMPVCSLVVCTAPGPVANGTVITSGPYDYNTDITYTCDLSFNLTSGNLTRTCQHDFGWSGSAPVCTVYACIKQDASLMTLNPDTVLHDFGSVITYTCIVGYNQSAGDLSRTCQNDGSWTGTLPACVIVKCPLPSAPDHGSIAPTDAEIEYNNTITYSCDTGYNRTFADDDIRTCTETGHWSGTESNCTLVTCDPPADYPFSTYHPVQSIYNYSTDVTYSCNYGYYLSSGTLTTQCDQFGLWTVSFVCSIVECTVTAEPHSTYSPLQTQFDFNTTVTYTCDVGHNRTSGNDVRTCTNDTTWDGAPPTCDPVVCNFPETVDYSTSVPSQLKYVYQDWINYTCVLGYEVTSGDATRQCDQHAEWTGNLPNCTIKKCAPPSSIVNASYSPVLLEHNWNTTVTYSCDIGYEYDTGDAVVTCLDSKAWSGTVPFACKVKTCPRIDVQFMTITPADTGGEYVYLTEVTYACVVGYYHINGDLQRTCQDTKDWSGILPNCTIVTCDPPADIAHTNYSPIQPEYIWQTELHYSCDPLYHYVAGLNVSTCNESGVFPPVDFNCSVMHTLVKNAAEPVYAWINETSTSADVLFDFDGMCDVTLSVNPNSVNVSHVISGVTLTLTVSEVAVSVYGTYVVTLSPFRLWRSFDDVTTNVYYGNKIDGLVGWVRNPITTLMVGGDYTFEVNVTDGTTVQLYWDFEGTGNITQYHSGLFSSATRNHIFNSPGLYNVTVTATNAISTETVVITVNVVYGPNNIVYTSTINTPNTTQSTDLQLIIGTAAFLPMYDVNITVYFGDDTANVTESRTIGPSLPLPTYYTYNHLYPIQGDYYAEAMVANMVGTMTYNQTIRVWDPLTNMDLGYVNGNGHYITNSTAEFQFVLPPESGFLYTMDYGDGSAVESVSNTGIYIHPYNVTSFTHVYTSPGVYHLHWTARNGLYSRDETKTIIVQNPVPPHSYTLDPVNKKYPWSVLQVMDVSMNITLNDTVALPTNASCEFDAGDGTPVVNNIEFDGAFFQHLHRFLVEGVFTPTFNCSNLVSTHDYVYTSITVLKYDASFTSLIFESLVPLNISDSVTVYYHIDNDGFALLPLGVTLTFDFHNGTQTYTYDQETYSRLYSKRGNYNVTITAESSVTNTTVSRSYPLRLGVMYFEVNSTDAFINDTVVTYSMHGVMGTTDYRVVYSDGSGEEVCNSTDISGCDIHHLCPQYGNNTNIVTANNGSFVEIDEEYVVCDNPIVVTIDHPDIQPIPDGTIDLKLRISATDLYIPNLFCNISMGDPIIKKTYRRNQTVTFEDPFNFTFQYIALGRHDIVLDCWNLINETRIGSTITLTNKDFLFFGSFDRQYAQMENPLPLTPMRDVELFSRLVVLAHSSDRFAVNDWELDRQPLGAGTGRYSLLFSVGQVSGGLYRVNLKTYFREEPDNAIFEPTYVSFKVPQPQVHFVGGRLQRVQSGTNFTLDAHTLSYDPGYPSSGLNFTSWRCFGYDATSFIDAENKFNASSGGTSCTLATVSGDSIKRLDLTETPQKPFYVVEVTAYNSHGISAANTQIIQAVGSSNTLSIRCLINCLSKVAVTSYLQLMIDSSHNCPATFSWTMKEKGKDVVLLSNSTDTGIYSRSLSIRPNTLSPGKWYVISAVMTYGGKSFGPAYYEFLTNRPPQEGSCKVYKFNYDTTSNSTALNSHETYSTMLRADEFNITCSGWLDEGFTENTFMENQPLFYYYYLQYGSNDTDRQMLYFDPGSTSNLVTVRIGDPDDGYAAKLVLRIADVIGDYTELTYNLNVTPPPNITTEAFYPLSDNQQLQILTDFTAQYEEEIIKANRTWDYRTLSRKIQDVTSVYNRLVLNSTESIVLTPEDLVSLGNQRNSEGNILSWNEYWKLIVEVQESESSNHLMQFGERLTAALYYTVSTWPESRMPLISIEVISKGLTGTLERTDYANNTAAILASYSSDVLSQHLLVHTNDRMFPHTEQLMCAMAGVFELNENILNLLQTVLTPNLPVDPTADEMRSFLEYIKIFEGSYNQSMLSLQEQTFLAQKQLQKYHLQKFLKSEASKAALPNVTNSLVNIGRVLNSMSTLGREEIKLDNEFTYLSAEKVRAFELRNSDIYRPRTVMEVGSLTEVTSAECNASEISVMTTIFKKNPYFWGMFADRITSYVSTFTLEGATLPDPTITFRLQNYIEPPCKDETPTYKDGDDDAVIYILFNRRYKDDDVLLFIRPEASQLTYEVYLNKDEKPDIAEEKYVFQTHINRNMWTAVDGYKLLITSQEFSLIGQIWIALRPLLGDSDDKSLLQKKFCARVTSVNCVVWKLGTSEEYNWDRHMCEVSELSSRKETVCQCTNPLSSSAITIGTTFYVPESKVDFENVDDMILAYSSLPVYGLIYATCVAYIVMVILLWREDMKDPYKWAYSLMIDNDIADQHFYLFRVYTGMRSGSGTKSNIAFILAGETSDTGIRILDDKSHLGFDRGSVRTFVMGTRRNLGELMSLRIWHDDTGVSEAAWYLNQITVTDLSTFQMYGFYCDSWFDYDRGDRRVDRVLPAQPIQETWSFKELASYTIAEHHMWISTFIRPFRSSFTRVQRLSCLLGAVYLNMFLTTLFLKTKTKEEIAAELVIGPFRFSHENLKVAFTVVALSTIIITIVSFFFRFARNKKHLLFKDSFLVRQYKKLNNRFRFDNRILTMFYPPAERAVVYDYNFLPQCVVYVAWTLLFLFVGLCAYMMVSNARSWPETKSEEWLTTVIVSGFVSFTVIELIKVTLIIIPYLLLCKRAYEPPRPYIDVESVKEVAKYNSASLTISPDFSNDLKAAVSPDEETLIEHKRERVNNHQLLKMFTELAVYSGILFIVYTISYAKRDPMSYSLKKNIEDSFSFDDEIKDTESYVDWLKGRFVERYFSHSFFGLASTDTNIKPFAEDLVNYRVGPARLRQLRVEPEPCLGPLGRGLTCYGKYKDDHIDTVDYCIGWKHKECDVSEKFDFFSTPAWDFKSAEEVWGFFTMATYATYGGGGYFMKLDVNKDVCLKIFEELVNFNWFDRKTRVAILEFTLYNANKNLFVYSKFVAEFPEVGRVLTFTDVQVFRLYIDSGKNGEMILLLEFVFALLVIGASIKIGYEIATDGYMYFKSVWNLLDLVALSMSYTTIIVYIYKLSILDRTIKLFHEDQNAYVGFENLAFYDFFVNVSHALLVFILSIRVSKILGYSGKINEMAAVISSSANDLGGFFLIFAIAYFAYVILGTELFRNDTEKYKDLFQTYGTLTEAIVGKNRLANIFISKPGYAEFYYFTFVIFVLMTLATLAAAILNFSISNVREEQRKLEPTNIVEILADRIAWIVSLISKKLSGKSKEDEANKDTTSEEDASPREILLEFRQFINQIKIGDGNKRSIYRADSSSSDVSYGHLRNHSL